MKFFQNLPKKQYSTDIGNLNISSFYSFYQKQTEGKRTNSIVIDDNTTLVEASLTVFSDTDSIWAFLISNSKSNPFDILQTNSTNYITENETKTSYSARTLTSSSFYASGVTFTLPVGSIATRFNLPSGASWEYSSVGNFDLDGPFALIEENNSYNTSLTAKYQGDSTGITFIRPNSANGFITYIGKGSTYYAIGNNTITVDPIEYTKSTYKEVANGKEILYRTSGGSKDSNSAPSKFDTENPTAQTITIEEEVKNNTKQLTSISPLDMASALSSIVTPKYSGL